LDNQFIKILKKIKNKYGYEIFSNLGLVNSLMADYAESEYKKERRLLVWVLESNCQNTLTAEQEYNDWKGQWIKRLNTEEYIDKDRASWALDRIFELLIAESYCIKRGFLLIEKDNLDDAEKLFNKIIKINQNSSDAFQGKGIIASKKGDFEKAINYFKKTIRIDSSQKEILQPIIFETYCKKADDLKRSNDFKSAIGCYKKALDIHSNNSLFIEIAKCNHMLSNYQLEIKLYTKLILSDPENTELYMYRAEAYTLIKDYDKALDDYNTVLEKNKDDIKAYIKCSYVHYLKGNIEAFFVDYSNLNNRYNIKFINEDNFPIFFKRRKIWERETGYIDNTKFPFKCASCNYFDETISICKKMKEIDAFPITSDGSRCHEYKKA